MKRAKPIRTQAQSEAADAKVRARMPHRNSSRSKSPFTAARFWRASRARPSLCRSRCPANRRACASRRASAATRPPRPRRLSRRAGAHRARLPALWRVRRLPLSARGLRDPTRLQAGHSARDAGARRRARAGRDRRARRRSHGAIAIASGWPSMRREIPAIAAAARMRWFRLRECPIAAPLLVKAALAFARGRRGSLRRRCAPPRFRSFAMPPKPRCWRAFLSTGRRQGTL